jgi:hypothetical protein
VLASDLGSRIVWRRRLRAFGVGGVNSYGLPAVVMDSEPAQTDRFEDGLLPTCLFQSVYFNHRKKFVIFNPK